MPLWSIAVMNKLTIVQQVRKFLASLLEPQSYRIRWSSPLGLSWETWTQSIPLQSYLFATRCNINFPSTLWSPKRPLSFMFSDCYLVCNYACLSQHSFVLLVTPVFGETWEVGAETCKSDPLYCKGVNLGALRWGRNTERECFKR
jgi:hypothetical protein